MPQPEPYQIKIDSNGWPLTATVFEPLSNKYCGITAIMSTATGAKQTYFRSFAKEVSTTHGIRVITYDYSGMGQSAPVKMKGFERSMLDWGLYDLAAVIDHVEAEFEFEQLIHIGQSVGGQIPGLCPSIHKVDGLVNVVSQSGYWKLWPFPSRYLLWINWNVLRIVVNLFGYWPGGRIGIVDNLPRNVALQWANWGLSPNYLMDHVETAEESFRAVKLPLLSFSFSDDRTAPKATVEWLNAQYSNCTLTHKHYKPSDLQMKKIGHFGFFRSECDILWLELVREVKSWYGKW